MKKILTSLLLIFILAASFSVLIRIQPVRATTFITENFESWNSNGWSIFGDGTQQDETTIVHGGSHSRNFTQPYDTKIMIYKEGAYATQTSNVTFWMYLPSDLNIEEGAILSHRKVVLDIYDVVEMDFGFWNDSGTIRPYVYRAEEEWSYYIYLTNASLSLASWHSISCTLYENDTGFVELSIDSSLVYHHDGDYWDNILSDGSPSYYVGFPLTNYSPYTATCYIDDLTVTDVLTEEPPSTFTVQVTSSPEINADYTINGTSHQTPHDETGLDAGSYNFTVTTINKTISGVDYDFEHWLINGVTEDGNVSILLSVSADSTLSIHYQTINHFNVSSDSEPSGLFSVHFSAEGAWYWTPQDLNLTEGSQTFTIESGSLIRIVNDTWIYGFDHWSITNTTGTFNSTGSSVDYNLQEDTNVTMAYSYVTISVNASPSEVLSHVFFSDEYYGTNFTAPETLHMNSGYHTLTATTYQYYPNSSYVYTFDYWLVNGTTPVGSLAINESFTGDTTLEMVYAGSTVVPPFTHIYAAAALNATWYFRSDTHTVATILGYRLLTTNTQTPAGYSISFAGSQDTSYGVRVWAVGFFNETYELTSGSPEVICTKATNGSEMMIGYWNCPAFNVMTNAIKVQVYQRFGSDSWSLTRIFITSANLLYRFPASTWTFHFYVSRIETSITNSTFWHGSYTTYNSRVDLEYYKANPWDVAMARLYQRNIFGFMFTPWTYWFGDVFWSILLFGCIVMGILRTGSLKLVLATLWILGGSGSILWALIPASALHIAVVMLALAMAITFFRLIRGK